MVPEPLTVGSGFPDVGSDVWWAPHVQMLANLGIVSGCGTGPARYCPTDPVTRGQMAATLARAFALPPAASSEYVDIEYNVHTGGIDALSALGIGTGCDVEPFRFCPEGLVTRNEAAVLVHQAMLQHRPLSGRGWVSYDLPADEMVETHTGQPVSLRSLVDGHRPMLLWFLSPW